MSDLLPGRVVPDTLFHGFIPSLAVCWRSYVPAVDLMYRTVGDRNREVSLNCEHITDLV